MQTGATRDDPNRFKFHGEEHYVKSAHEMRALFSELPEACDNTLWIAERASVEIELGRPSLPKFPLPEAFVGAGESYEESAAAYLRHLTYEGARDRYGAVVAGRGGRALGVRASGHLGDGFRRRISSSSGT